MTKGNVIRVMENKDLCYFPEIRDEFNEYGHHGNYFFFVIKEVIEGEEEILGYLIAEKIKEKAVITKMQLFDEVKQKEVYRNTAMSNLYEYVKAIKNCDGKRRFFQVSVI